MSQICLEQTLYDTLKSRRRSMSGRLFECNVVASKEGW